DEPEDERRRRGRARPDGPEVERRQEYGEKACLEEQRVPLKREEIAGGKRERKVGRPRYSRAQRRNDVARQAHGGKRSRQGQTVQEAVARVEPAQRGQEAVPFRACEPAHDLEVTPGGENPVAADQAVELNPERDEGNQV